MRSYLIDEMSQSDMQKMRGFMQDNAEKSDLDSLFWGRLPQNILSEIQYVHSGCQPHVFAIELGKDWIKLELFIRSLTGMKCECQGYCTSQQKSFIINFADKALQDLHIKT